MSFDGEGKSPLTAYCVKCRTADKNMTRKPVYAARAKTCGRWVGACPRCFRDKATAKTAVVAHIRKYRGCGWCRACEMIMQVQNIEPPGTADIHRMMRTMFDGLGKKGK